MFARIKKSGKYQYLQIVENRKEDKKVKQTVITTLGRLEDLQEKGRIETLIRSLSRFSEKALLIISGKSELSADAKKIGPALIFERLWEETGIKKAILKQLKGRRFEFDVERAVFLTVLHRLMVSGSDRFCDRWRRDYLINGIGGIGLHHMYRAMGFLGKPLEEAQTEAAGLSPRCTKDLIEENIFDQKRELFSSLDMVFFDTTSLYFEGQGGPTLGQRGFSKDHRPDLNQIVVGAAIDDRGRPISCELWPGNTTDVKTLVPVVERIRRRFGVGWFCVVADRGMISADTVKKLEDPETKISYILGTRMRRVKEIELEVLSRAGRYREVHAETNRSKDPEPLKVKEVIHNGRRYIVCVNPRQVRKDKADREAILESLKEQLKSGVKTLIGNKGYRKYLKVSKENVEIDEAKVEYEARFDGKWVLTTNTNLSSEKVALKYKELWQVEQVFRDLKSILETRPIYHQKDETIRGHVFCSFLALMLRKELERRLEAIGHQLEWAQIKQDLKALQQIELEEDDKRFIIRSQSKGVCGKVFQAVGVAMPPVIRVI